jgi:hypothetical protein
MLALHSDIAAFPFHPDQSTMNDGLQIKGKVGFSEYPASEKYPLQPIHPAHT